MFGEKILDTKFASIKDAIQNETIRDYEPLSDEFYQELGRMLILTTKIKLALAGTACQLADGNLGLPIAVHVIPIETLFATMMDAVIDERADHRLYETMERHKQEILTTCHEAVEIVQGVWGFIGDLAHGPVLKIGNVYENGTYHGKIVMYNKDDLTVIRRKLEENLVFLRMLERIIYFMRKENALKPDREEWMNEMAIEQFKAALDKQESEDSHKQE